MSFRYADDTGRGEGLFELHEDAEGFSGRWRAEGDERWSPWFGRRAEPGATEWLVVLEAPWQSDLSEPEYSFGAMLQAIFERAPGVEVRQRSFSDAESFAALCAEAAGLAGSVVVVVAAHGGPEGVWGQTSFVPTPALARALAQIPGLRAVHFSSCSVMAGPGSAEIVAACAANERFEGVSGYAAEVDWMASALCDFTYLELLLARGCDVERAATGLAASVRFAGVEPPAPASPLPALDFRCLPAQRGPRE